MNQQTDCLNNADLNLMIMFYIHSLQTMFGPSRNILSSKQGILKIWNYLWMF